MRVLMWPVINICCSAVTDSLELPYSSICHFRIGHCIPCYRTFGGHRQCFVDSLQTLVMFDCRQCNALQCAQLPILIHLLSVYLSIVRIVDLPSIYRHYILRCVTTLDRIIYGWKCASETAAIYPYPSPHCHMWQPAWDL